MFIKGAEQNNNASLFLFRAPERIFLGIFSHTGALYQNIADGFFITAPFIRLYQNKNSSACINKSGAVINNLALNDALNDQQVDMDSCTLIPVRQLFRLV
jgi:hypothetical protein